MSKLELKHAKALNFRLRAMQMSVSPDGKKLTVSVWASSGLYEHRKYSFSFWDANTGGFLGWGSNPGNDFNGERALLSPDW